MDNRPRKPAGTPSGGQFDRKPGQGDDSDMTEPDLGRTTLEQGLCRRWQRLDSDVEYTDTRLTVWMSDGTVTRLHLSDCEDENIIDTLHQGHPCGRVKGIRSQPGFRCSKKGRAAVTLIRGRMRKLNAKTVHVSDLTGAGVPRDYLDRAADEKLIRLDDDAADPLIHINTFPEQRLEHMEGRTAAESNFTAQTRLLNTLTHDVDGVRSLVETGVSLDG